MCRSQVAAQWIPMRRWCRYDDFCAESTGLLGIGPTDVRNLRTKKYELLLIESRFTDAPNVPYSPDDAPRMANVGVHVPVLNIRTCIVHV